MATGMDNRMFAPKRNKRKPANQRPTSAAKSDPGPPELAALFVELESSSPAEETRILAEAGLLPNGEWKGLEGKDLYALKMGSTEACLTANDLDTYIGAKGWLLRDEPTHLRECDDCRQAFGLYRQIRGVDIRRMAKQGLVTGPGVTA